MGGAGCRVMDGHSLLGFGKFKELLFNIFSQPENKHILAYILKILNRFQTPIWEVMEANYMYDLNIQDFARIANRSLSTFKRGFKKHYQTSPGKKAH